MIENHSCLKIDVRPTDYRRGDGKLKLTGITPINWNAHYDFFVPQKVSDGDTDDCWDFGSTKDLDAFMDALISEGALPADVILEIQNMGFMDTGIDGKPHFHSSERFAGVLSGLGRNGGNLYTAYDIFRKYGCVPFTVLHVVPTMTLAEYFDTAALTPEIMALGEKFLNLMGGKDFLQYEWVNDGGPTDVPAIQSALATEAITIGIPVNVAGWNQTHPTIATGPAVHVVSVRSVEGQSTNISDNYNPFDKVLDPGYQISYVLGMVVQYIPPSVPSAPAPAPDVLTPTPNVPDTLSWLSAILNWLSQIIKGRNLSSNQMNNSYSFSKADLIKIGKGLGIAVLGAALTYLASYVSNTNFGVYTPVVVAVFSVLVNAIRKFVANTAPTDINELPPAAPTN